MRRALSITSEGLDAHSFACDLTNSTQLAALVDYVESTHGRADMLVNCAGVTTQHDSHDYPDEPWSGRTTSKPACTPVAATTPEG